MPIDELADVPDRACRRTIRGARHDQPLGGKNSLFRVGRKTGIAIYEERALAEVRDRCPLQIDDPGVNIAPCAEWNVLNGDVVDRLDL